MTVNVELTGAVRLYRAASSDRRQRDWPPGWAIYAWETHQLRDRCLWQF